MWVAGLVATACGVLVWVVGPPFSQSRVVASGRATMVPVQQFERLHPGASHFVSYLTGTHGTPTWNSVAGLYGRYELTMQVPVRLNAMRNGVASYGQPVFALAEVRSVTPGAAGALDVTHGGVDATFGPAEWQKVVDRGGDFGALGLSLQMNQPVPGFNTYLGRTSQ